MSAPSVPERVAGGLLGVAAGDALGATVEFLPADEIARRHGTHRDITGGGVFGRRPGQGTDDTDLAFAVARPTPRDTRSTAWAGFSWPGTAAVPVTSAGRPGRR